MKKKNPESQVSAGLPILQRKKMLSLIAQGFAAVGSTKETLHGKEVKTFLMENRQKNQRYTVDWEGDVL